MKIAICGSHPATKMKAPFGDPEWKIWACSPHNYKTHGEDTRLPRVDEWFELHKPANDGERYVPLDNWLKASKEPGKIIVDPEHGPVVVLPPTRPMDYLEWVRDEVSKQIPVWVRDTEFFKAVVDWAYDSPPADLLVYPEAKLKQRFSPFHFTSSIAYVMAKAIADLSGSLGIKGNMAAYEVMERVKEADNTIGLFGIVQASPNEYQYQRPGIQYFINEAHRAGITVMAPKEARLFDVVETNW